MRIWVPAVFALMLISPVFADLSANVTISPSYVDTNVINQTFVYKIIPLNNESINRTVIYAPENYSIVAVQGITTNPTNDSCLLTFCQQVEVNYSQIIVNFTQPLNSTNSPIIITFLVNTSSSSQLGNFTSVLNNTVYENSTVFSVNSTQVITQQMINVTGVTMVKGTAVINGTDYWEFKFVLGFTASQLGLIQFRMNDWLDASNNRLNANTSSTASYATFRNDSNFNTTGKFNITTAYGNNIGINRTSVTDFYLRMIIPTGTPPSGSWSTSYNFLFRATP